ncbi:MAG TPA: iron ABC transporter permease [Acidimicrobiales bacterium]|nr:iron ABC transporter permease [Acidimicrobiales bacterium]
MTFTKKIRWITLASLPAIFIGAFFYWPLIRIFSHALGSEKIDEFGALLLSGSFHQIAWFTVWQAALSTVLTMLLALPVSYLMARYSFRGRRILQILITVPFVLPTVVVAGAFTALFERFGLDGGAFRLRHTVWALLAAHVFFNLAIAIRTVSSFWSGLDPRIEEQAKLLGATPGRIFRKVTFPRLVPALTAAASIVFLFCLTSFGVILLLSGPTRATIETEIWRQAVWRGDIAAASSLAVIQLITVLVMVFLMNFLQRRQSVIENRTNWVYEKPPRKFLAGNIVLLLVVVGLPIIVLLERSIAVGEGYSIQNFISLADRVALVPVSALTALKNSLFFAALAAIFASLLGGIASLVVVHGRRWISNLFDMSMMLPLGISAVVLGFGMLIALDTPPLDLRSSWILVPIAHALLGIPFVMRTVVPTLRRIDPSLRESAALLGASPRQVNRRIDFPIALRALSVGAAFAFAISIGEFGATSFLPRNPDRLTAPLVLFRLLGAPGEVLRGQAMALAVVLMTITALTVILVEGSFFNKGTTRSDF